jgi:hypothetical protein
VGSNEGKIGDPPMMFVFAPEGKAGVAGANPAARAEQP